MNKSIAELKKLDKLQEKS